MRNKPPSLMLSVDAALRLIHLLRDEGSLSVTEVSRGLGISRSSAHRLLTTLVYRDFAAQSDDRRYYAGPALMLSAHVPQSVLALRAACLPAMRNLADLWGETVSLGLLLGTRVRIVATTEARRVLRVGDQEGTVLPARRTANGRAVLSTLSEEQVARLHAPSDGEEPLPPAEWRSLQRALKDVRSKGFAVNHGEAEAGVSALAVPFDSDGVWKTAALAFAVPSSRFATLNVASMADALSATIGKVRSQSTPDS